MRSNCIAAILAVFTVASGCTEQAASPAGPADGIRSSAVDQSGGAIRHAPIRQRFGKIEILARSPLRVGSSVIIEVDAPLLVASSSIHLRLHLPEVAEVAFRQKHGANVRGPQSPSPYLHWKGGGQAGVVRQTASVVFPIPGLYQVGAYLVSDDPGLDAQGEIQNAAGTVAWIYVTEKGGRIIHSFADLVADREASTAVTVVDAFLAAPQMAVTTIVPVICDPLGAPCDPCDLDPTQCAPPPGPGPASGTFSGTLVYLNQRFQRLIGLANASVAIFDDRGGWSNTVQTDGNGKFTLQCPDASLRGHLQMVASAVNQYTDVLDVNQTAAPPHDLSYFRPQADASIDKCGTDTGPYLVEKPVQAEVFDNISQTAIRSRTAFPGFQRSLIKVRWLSGPVDSAGSYLPSSDEIEINEVRSVGEAGLFNAAHEYGHALHHFAVGGIIISAVNLGECQNHGLASITNWQCAFVEGFADYHAVAVWGPQVGGAMFAQIDGGQHAGFPAGTPGTPIGPQTEGAIASTLLHMGDGKATRSVRDVLQRSRTYVDDVALGHGQVAAAIRDCRITLNGSATTVRVDGIDYLSYCLEKDVLEVIPPPHCIKFNGCFTLPAAFLPIVDSAARARAFGTLRKTHPLFLPLPATAWSWGTVPPRPGFDQSVRTVWLCNLFFCQ